MNMRGVACMCVSKKKKKKKKLIFPPYVSRLTFCAFFSYKKERFFIFLRKREMGLLSLLRKVKEKEGAVRVLVLGLDNAGKTTLVKRLAGEPIDTISPTFGFNIQTLLYQTKPQPQTTTTQESYQLHFWDIGGQKSLRSYWKNYVRISVVASFETSCSCSSSFFLLLSLTLYFLSTRTHKQHQQTNNEKYEVTEGLIWVVDSADVVRLEDCKQELLSLLQEERLFGATLLILANKQDLAGALSCSEIARVLELETSVTKRHWAIFSSSALTEDGLEPAIDWLVNDISSRL
jgi:ADP-ribosylation factor-like protein 2